MDVVNLKYENFKSFCKSILPENEYIKLLQATPLNLFLHTMKEKHDATKTNDQIADQVLEMAKIQKEDIKEEDLVKFKRYIEYFNMIIKTMG